MGGCGEGGRSGGVPSSASRRRTGGCHERARARKGTDEVRSSLARRGPFRLSTRPPRRLWVVIPDARSGGEKSRTRSTTENGARGGAGVEPDAPRGDVVFGERTMSPERATSTDTRRNRRARSTMARAFSIRCCFWFPFCESEAACSCQETGAFRACHVHSVPSLSCRVRHCWPRPCWRARVS